MRVRHEHKYCANFTQACKSVLVCVFLCVQCCVLCVNLKVSAKQSIKITPSCMLLTSYLLFLPLPAASFTCICVFVCVFVLFVVCLLALKWIKFVLHHTPAHMPRQQACKQVGSSAGMQPAIYGASLPSRTCSNYACAPSSAANNAEQAFCHCQLQQTLLFRRSLTYSRCRRQRLCVCKRLQWCVRDALLNIVCCWQRSVRCFC